MELPLSFYAGQGELLALIARGAPLADTLGRLAELIESQSPGLVCSVLLLDPDGVHVRPGAAPSLPPGFMDALDGQTIGPCAGSCGTAMHRRERVVVRDIHSDPLWAPYVEMVRPLGFRSCWSTPIASNEGQVLGAFAMYDRVPREPRPLEMQLLDAATSLAGIAIQRQRREDELQRYQTRLEALVEQRTAELQQSLLEQRAVFDNTTVGILIIKDRVVQRCNRYLEEMLGYGPGELNGRPTRDYYVSDEDWLAFGERSQQALATPAGYTGDFLAQRKDGRQIWCSSHGKLLDPGDPARGSVWVGVDITERRIAERAQQQLLLEYRAILDNAPVGITFTRERIFLHCNERFAEMFGYPVDELIGQATVRVYPSVEAYKELGRRATPVLSSGERFDTDIQMQRRDGSLFWCRVSAKAIDAGDPTKGTIFITEDIDDRIAADGRLQQALAELQAIFDNHHAGVLLVQNHQIQRCNACFERMLGYAEGSLSGRGTRELFLDDASFETLRDLAEAAVHSGRVWIGEATLRHARGHAVHVSAHAKAVEAGDPDKGTIWVALDISAHQAAEHALREANDKLGSSLRIVERASRELSQLGELSGFLQACEGEREAFDCVRRYVPALFPGSAGALYLRDEASGLLQEQLAWGDLDRAEPCFPSSLCWALRRGRPYLMTGEGLCCGHLGSQPVGGSACLPLVAQGETFGLLLVVFGDAGDDGDARGMHERLAIALSEQCALALANIRLRDTLRQQSVRDPLTGLYNRRFLGEALRRELARLRRGQRGCALAIVDVDHFKQFNDRYGHEAGDEVLIAVARSLQAGVRDCDLVCRLGGEEFVVLWTDFDGESARVCAERLLAGIRALRLQHGGRELGAITASLGLALAPRHGDQADSLLAAADAALYLAKGSGRNRLCLAEDAQALDESLVAGGPR